MISYSEIKSGDQSILSHFPYLPKGRFLWIPGWGIVELYRTPLLSKLSDRNDLPPENTIRSGTNKSEQYNTAPWKYFKTQSIYPNSIFQASPWQMGCSNRHLKVVGFKENRRSLYQDGCCMHSHLIQPTDAITLSTTQIYSYKYQWLTKKKY